MGVRPRLLAVLLAVCCFGCGCTAKKTNDPSLSSSGQNISGDREESSFFSQWSGEKVSKSAAAQYGILMWEEGSVADKELWESFLSKTEKGDAVQLTTYREGCLTCINAKKSGDDYSALISIKEFDGDKLTTHGRSITPAKVSCVRSEEGRLEYYLSDLMIYSCEADSSGDNMDTPAELSVYQVSPDAAMTFPFQRMFSSYSDVESYWDKYGSSLGSEELLEDMKSYQEEGGFNTHIVFLYGDISASGETKYEFLRASRCGSGLDIFLKKSSGSTGGPSKWQLACKISGEYLSDVSPDNISWTVYTDIETRG